MRNSGRSVAGALLGAFLLGACRSETATPAYRDGVDTGYLLGSADAVKRLYWSKQALEHPPVDSALPAAPAP